LLLTFGLAVAGMGTMTVLRTYLIEQRDAAVAAWFQQVQGMDATQLAECTVRYNGYLVAVVDSSGAEICTNVPRSYPQPDLSDMTLSWSYLHDGRITEVAAEIGKVQWHVMTSLFPRTDGSFVTLVAGMDNPHI